MNIYLNKKHYKLNLKIFFTRIFVFVFCVWLFAFGVEVCKFSEQYITTYKYQLYNELKQGIEEAIHYYKSSYIDNGRVLFDDINVD